MARERVLSAVSSHLVCGKWERAVVRRSGMTAAVVCWHPLDLGNVFCREVTGRMEGTR